MAGIADAVRNPGAPENSDTDTAHRNVPVAFKTGDSTNLNSPRARNLKNMTAFLRMNGLMMLIISSIRHTAFTFLGFRMRVPCAIVIQAVIQEAVEKQEQEQRW